MKEIRFILMRLMTLIGSAVRSRNIGLSLLLTLMLLSNTSSDKKEESSGQYPDFVVNRDVKIFLTEHDESAVDYKSNSNRTGIFLTSALPPNAGRLLIEHKSSGIKDSCSGIALDNSHFLTAAHCLCNIHDIEPSKISAQECRNNFNDLNLSIFFPRFGLRTTIKEIRVHDKYFPPARLGDSPNTPVADLAILTFHEPIQGTTLKLEHGKAGKYLISSFGNLYFTLEQRAREIGFPIGTPLQDGVAQVWRIQGLFFDQDSCGSAHAPDTGCSLYDSQTGTIEAGPLQGVTVCHGDSGAPLLQWSATEGWSLIGITSYFTPSSFVDRCQADVSRRNHFVLVSLYQDWINDIIQHQDWINDIVQHWNSSSEPICLDGVFRVGTIDLFNFHGLITATGFDASEADDMSRPKVSIGVIGNQCIEKGEFGVISCFATSNSYVEVKIPKGFAQITMCKGETQ